MSIDKACKVQYTTFKEKCMLEYNFTKLDDDFITLWSRFILTDDIKPEIGALQELAERNYVYINPQTSFRI